VVWEGRGREASPYTDRYRESLSNFRLHSKRVLRVAVFGRYEIPPDGGDTAKHEHADQLGTFGPLAEMGYGWHNQATPNGHVPYVF